MGALVNEALNKLTVVENGIRQMLAENDRLKRQNAILRDYILTCFDTFGKDAMPYDPEDTGMIEAMAEGE